MASFTAYFDDSGGSDTKAIVIAGFVAPLVQWAKFNDEWNAVLDDPVYGLPRGTVFHMREFAHSKGCFASFQRHQTDTEVAFRRKQFIARLVGFTRVRATISVSCSLSLETFAAADARYLLKESFGGAFAFAGRTCAASVRQWATKRGLSISDIEFVFEDGMKDRNDLKVAMKRDGFPEPRFEAKSRDWPPLQAADLIAWEFHKAMKQAFEENLKDLRKSFESILKMPGSNGVFPNADDLISKCIIPAGVPERS